jgi:hypothetical protein
MSEFLYFRRFRGGIERFSLDDIKLRIPIRTEPIGEDGCIGRLPLLDRGKWREYLLLDSGRWLQVGPALGSEVSIVQTDEDFVRLDLRRNGIPIPSELSDLTKSEFSEREIDNQIFEALRHKGHRLTTLKLLKAMEEVGGATSESTLKKRLAQLVKAKRLDNSPKAKPRGYGLPKWNGSTVH